jgi:hypothetical protein
MVLLCSPGARGEQYRDWQKLEICKPAVEYAARRGDALAKELDNFSMGFAVG